MKKLLFVGILIFIIHGCLVQREISNCEYLTIRQIQQNYRLSKKECILIIKAAENNEIESRYDIESKCWKYDNNIDYSLFRLAK